MTIGEAPQRSSRGAWAFIVIGTSLIIAALLYLQWAGRERELPPPNVLSEGQMARLNALLQVLYFTLLLAAVFVIGAYVMTRLGRWAVRREPSDSTKTEYVDAWSRYRITDDEIRQAIDPPPDQAPDNRPPDG